MDPRLKDLRGPGRRQFLKWSATVAAVLGLERSRYLTLLGDQAGTAMADNGACGSTNRSVHLVAGNGGLSNFTLLWPQVAIAMGSDPNFAFHAMGKATTVQGTDKPLVYAPESPFQKLPSTKQVTAFMAGANETHTNVPESASMISAGVGMIAAVAAIQSANPTLLPVIGVNPVVFGVAPGAPSVATVASADGLVGLFNSAASKTLLAAPANASLHEAYYKAFVGLNAAAGRSTFASSLNTGKVAVNLLGKNLSDQLKPTAQDDANYGIDAGTATKFVEIAHALMTGVKAFRLGLTSSLIIPAMRDDPHGMFAGGDQMAVQTAATLGRILDAFMADCAKTPDPSCTSKSLADNLVLTVHGDTTKDPTQRSGWPDGTPGNSNTLYVFGNGYLKTGWFGNIDAQGNASGWDPTTGKDVNGQASSVTSMSAAAAVAYAVAKGDMRRVEDFYSGPVLSGVVNAAQM